MNIVFDENALEDYSNWSVVNKNVFRKIRDLLRDIKRNPYDGIGKPEPLKYELSGFWSRRIDEKNRLVYQINDNNDIIVISCKGHYNEK
jgi:toxin YoeB